MPVITRPDGSAVAAPAEQTAILAALGLTVAREPVPHLPALPTVLAEHRLSPETAAAILAGTESATGDLYGGRDVIALFPDTPGLDSILAAFHRVHTHSDPEVRYILAGEGVFGFVLPGGEQVEITVTAGDLLGVPPGTRHWFRLTPQNTVVAVRLFGENPQWHADYLDIPIRFASR